MVSANARLIQKALEEEEGLSPMCSFLLDGIFEDKLEQAFYKEQEPEVKEEQDGDQELKDFSHAAAVADLSSTNQEAINDNLGEREGERDLEERRYRKSSTRLVRVKTFSKK